MKPCPNALPGKRGYPPSFPLLKTIIYTAFLCLPAKSDGNAGGKQGLLAAQGEKGSTYRPQKRRQWGFPITGTLLHAAFPQLGEDAPRLLPFEHLQEFSGSLLLHLNKASKTLPEQVLAENVGPGAKLPGFRPSFATGCMCDLGQLVRVTSTLQVDVVWMKKSTEVYVF